jgi:hypothetical protein
MKPRHGPPGPLGRLIQRRRLNLGIKSQQDLSDLTFEQGLRVPQNTISRIESGATQTMHPDYLAAVGKALGLGSDEDFIMAAYAPGVRRTKPAKTANGDTDYPPDALVIPAADPQLRELLEVAMQLDPREVPRLIRAARVFLDIPALEDDTQDGD